MPMHSSETSYSAVTIHWAGEAFFGHPSIAVRSSGYPRPMKNYCPISRWEILSLSTYSFSAKSSTLSTYLEQFGHIYHYHPKYVMYFELLHFFTTTCM